MSEPSPCMSETPSKLRQPRKLSAKIDLDALKDGRFDAALIENLKIIDPQQQQQQPPPPKQEGNQVNAIKKRKPQSPARIGGNSLRAGGAPTTTSVPRRTTTSSSSSSLKNNSNHQLHKSSVFPAMVRKPITSNFVPPPPPTKTEDFESKVQERLQSKLLIIFVLGSN
jgi:hypothetical protein